MLIAACSRSTPAPVCQCEAVADAGAAHASAVAAEPVLQKPVRQEPGTHTPPVQALAVCEAKNLAPLDAARTWFDAGEYEKALSCAAQASALAPNDVLAHTEHGNALSALNRFDEAKMAYARALALEPESLEALLGAAHLYALALPSARDVDELGSIYAERGFDLATSAHNDDLAIDFAGVSAVAFNDIGMPTEALERADYVLQRRATDGDALYEKGLAAFELCRFDEARKVFQSLLKDPERSAHAHYHLGLILERDAKDAQSAHHFEKARAERPEDFPAPVEISAAEFEAQLQKTLAALPDDMQRDLKGVPVVAEDLPALADLTAGEPVLSPTILGLFRGPPLGASCDGEGTPCRSVAVYRKNLARAVKTRDELDEQLRVTVLHEVGHLRGEDDSELAARGLE